MCNIKLVDSATLEQQLQNLRQFVNPNNVSNATIDYYVEELAKRFTLRSELQKRTLEQRKSANETISQLEREILKFQKKYDTIKDQLESGGLY